MRSSDKSGFNVPALLGCGFVLMFAAVFWGAFATGDKTLIQTLSEALKAVVFTVAGYYFGSSKGSQAKDEALAQLAATPPPAAADPAPGAAAE